MKALVIGAAGFVGDYLINAIKEDLLCDIYATKLPYQSYWRDDITIVDLNILNEEDIQNCLSKISADYIFYLAAQSSISKSWQDPVKTVEINIKGSLNVLNVIRKLDNNPRVLMVGSGEEYGLIDTKFMPLKETTQSNPQNIYAATKACQNMMASVYSLAYGMQLIMVRAFNHIGAGQLDTFVVSNFCHQVVNIEHGKQEPIIYVGNLQAKRDFTDVRDIVRAYTRLIQFGIAGETYNVGSGQAVSIESILNKIIERSSVHIKIQVDEKRLRPIDAPIIEADISKIFATTGWKPKISLDDTLDTMLEYWRNNYDGV